MHKEGQPNQASPQPDRRGERRGGPKKILTLRSDRAGRLVCVALTWDTVTA